jgi:hypothetical protein
MMMMIRQCPNCRRVVSLHLNRYRCSWCHIWLKEEQCLEIHPASAGAGRALDVESPEVASTLAPTETDGDDDD